VARVEPERHTLFDGTPLTIRPADTGDGAVVTLGLFRSVLEEGRYAVQTLFEVTVTGERSRVLSGRPGITRPDFVWSRKGRSGGRNGLG
jgi:hypothetical protein